MAAIATAGLHGAAKIIAIDLDANRLEKSRDFGGTDTVLSGTADRRKQVISLTNGVRVEVTIESIGVPDTFKMATEIVQAGGHVANIGVDGKKVALCLESLWIANLFKSMGLVNTDTTPMLLKLVESKKLPAAKMVTHRFSFDQFLDAYDTLSLATETKALEVIIVR